MKQVLVLLTLFACLPLIAHAQAPEKKPIDAQIAKLVDKLQAASAEERPALLKQLGELIRKQGVTPIRIGTMPGIIVEIGASFPSESMSGSWVGDHGEKGTYTLKSLGKGGYRLDGRITLADGTRSNIKDEGKMPGLQKKYLFLKEWTFMTPRAIPVGITIKTPSTVRVNKLGITLRRPSPDLEYHLKLAAETSWIIDKVIPGSRAEKLGLKRHDLLVGADADDLSDLATLRNATKSLSVVRRAKAKPARIALAE